MRHYPDEPQALDEELVEGEFLLRYEDVAQDGRLMIGTLPEALGQIWRKVLMNRETTRQYREEGVIPILSRIVLDGDDGIFSVRDPLKMRGVFRLAHSRDAGGEVDRLFLNMWASIRGPKGRTHGPPPDDEGTMVSAGRIFAEHVFTKPFAPPAERKVKRFSSPGLPEVPSEKWSSRSYESILALPAGANPLDAAIVTDPNDMTIQFGLTHTDSNLHVNSLVYPRMFEEAALRRANARKKNTGSLLARYIEVAFRKPFFSGEKAVVALQLYEHDGHLGAVGVFLPDTATPVEKANCFVHLKFA